MELIVGERTEVRLDSGRGGSRGIHWGSLMEIFVLERWRRPREGVHLPPPSCRGCASRWNRKAWGRTFFPASGSTFGRGYGSGQGSASESIGGGMRERERGRIYTNVAISFQLFPNLSRPSKNLSCSDFDQRPELKLESSWDIICASFCSIE